MAWTKPSASRPENLLLRAVRSAVDPPAVLNAEAISLEQGAIVCEPGDAMRHVYLPISCVLSAVSVHNDGSILATTLRGHEGAFGLLTALRKAKTHGRCQAQIGGSVLRLDANELERIFDMNKMVRRLFLSYWDAVMLQYEQAAICNMRHLVSARLSKCLLDIHNRTVGDSFPFTHQHMANLIAANRSTISVIAADFRRSGLIETDRGYITIIDRRGLRAASCECYARVRSCYEKVFGS